MSFTVNYLDFHFVEASFTQFPLFLHPLLVALLWQNVANQLQDVTDLSLTITSPEINHCAILQVSKDGWAYSTVKSFITPFLSLVWLIDWA